MISRQKVLIIVVGTTYIRISTEKLLGLRMVDAYTDKKGYKHFSNSGIPVHRYVASRMVGGPIGKGRVVHHRDGNKQNNSRSNLHVMSRSNHSRHHARRRRY
jgi:hypothetical protein